MVHAKTWERQRLASKWTIKALNGWPDVPLRETGRWTGWSGSEQRAT